MKTFPFTVLWLAITISLTGPGLHAQTRPLTLQDCIEQALQHNLRIKTDSLKAAQEDALKKTAFDPGKTNFSLGQDPTGGGNNDNALGITQSFAWPDVYVQQGKVLQQQSLLTKKGKALTASDVITQVKLNYYNYVYQAEKIKVINYLDSVYQDFSLKASVRARTGETGQLEVLAAQNKLEETEVLQKQTQSDLQQYALALQELINSPQPVILAADSLTAIPWEASPDSLDASQNPRLDYFDQQIKLAAAKVRLEKAKLWPDLTIGYSQQFLLGGFNPAHIDREYFPGTRIGGFQAGIGLPLFAGSYAARIKAEKIGVALANNQLESSRRQLQTAWQQSLKAYDKYIRSLDYYRASGLKLAEEQIRVAQVSFTKGEIGYVEFIQNISQAAETKLNYLSVLNQLNEAVIHLQYLQGKLQ
jgi:cobalt-zinc-cadmium resistance protein CzcA